ncbi:MULTISPECIES: ABC transporter substrate-binding protein [unclassified Bradyrhizobium]|uniref:ABC transporter substrate-binding protein n=1 Tax=unclassified Bradyrhizobium TaxID=2631580 RepID=UPI001FF70BD1|nr:MULTISPECIES: ABC transporter substrate-binding protein [unclassified Bradyrhizobium]MCK1419465.1 ABC transporter substrate-binding protein [Bradyrhizobium sp. CW12]MCK1644666.1 ABC transporter substrate-binding protein [Bradyrhizobium sp. 154]
MTKQDFRGRSRGGLSRRSLLRSMAAILSLPFAAKATAAWAQEKLAGSGEVVVFSYGGSFTDGARKYVFDPFTKATGIKIVDVVADYAEPQVKAMFRAGRVDWDVAFVEAKNYPEMREAGMFEPIDYSLWDQESLEGTPPDARLKDVVVGGTTSTMIAYDKRAFPKGGPQNWVDFWDVKKFPGPRGLPAKVAKGNVQFALLASGVAPKDIWPLTDDKVDRAFEKLNEIKPHIKKWLSSGGEPLQLLINRELAAASAYNNRSIVAIRQGAPIEMVWDGAYTDYTWIAVLKGGPNTGNGQKFIAFLNRAQIAAGWTFGTGWPGPNTNQLKYLPADMVPLLNINPENRSKTITEDSAWMAAKRPDGKTNNDHLQERWLAWRAQ